MPCARPRPALALALLALACAAPPRVDVDAAEDLRIEPGQTFALDTEALAEGEPAWGPTARATARRVLDEALRGRGLAPAAEGEAPDWRVAVGVRSATRVDAEPGVVADEPPRIERRVTGVRTPVGDVPLAEERRVVPGRGYGAPAAEHTRHSRSVVVRVHGGASDEPVWEGASTRRHSREEIDPADLERRLRAIAAELPIDAAR